MTIQKTTEKNFERHIKNNSYPGRGIVIGKLENSENWVIVYFIMGRSENSKNRLFYFGGEKLWTAPFDESKVTDPSLIIYNAMNALPGIQIVSNGNQTDTIYNAIKCGGTFTGALNTRDREPDAPNYTPRISGIIDFNSNTPKIEMSILKASQIDKELTDRTTFMPSNPIPGTGYCLTTYMGDADPLPSFNGDPILLPLKGTGEDILDYYWDSLNKNNKVSLVVKEINPKGQTTEFNIANIHSAI